MKNNKNTVAILQARMGSSRLPGKVLMEICDKPLIQHVIDRIHLSREIHTIILATTTLPADNKIQDMAVNLGVQCYRGEELDVLSRYYGAATKTKAEVIVRISGDDPLIDPRLIDKLVSIHIASGTDYTSTYTGEEDRTYPLGLRTEVFEYSAIRKAYNEARQDHEREHVTPYIYLHRDIFKVEVIEASTKLRRPDLRLTVDTPEDFKLITQIYQQLYHEGKMFYTEEVIEFLDQHPEMMTINNNIRQKRLGE